MLHFWARPVDMYVPCVQAFSGFDHRGATTYAHVKIKLHITNKKFQFQSRSQYIYDCQYLVAPREEESCLSRKCTRAPNTDT